MAGKTWSEEEEAYFWLHIVPFSRRRRGADLANPELSFEQLGEKMQAAMRENARRQYTALCLEEHFYQNVETGQSSKNARKWVKKYKALAKEYPGLPEKSTRATHEINGEAEQAHPATKAGAETDWELGGDENAEKLSAILKLAEADSVEITGRIKSKRGRDAASEEQASSGLDKGKGMQVEGDVTEDSELFTGRAPATSGDTTDATVADTTGATFGDTIDEGVDHTFDGDIEATSKGAIHPEGNGRTEEYSAVTTECAKENSQAAVESMQTETLVGGFLFSDDSSRAGDDTAGQRDETAQATQNEMDTSRE